MTTIREQVAEVAVLRNRLAELSAEYGARVAAWQESARDLNADLDVTKATLRDAEQMLREMALAEYARTGSKQPGPGVGIREVKRLEYDEAAAFTWAKSHDLALKLDTAAFESIAKGGATVECVTIRLEPQATIATDLVKALGEEGDDGS